MKMRPFSLIILLLPDLSFAKFAHVQANQYAEIAYGKTIESEI